MPDLEERVAALEARLAPGPLLKPFGLPPLTEEREAELRREFDETMPKAAGKPFRYRILPSPPPLTPDQVRQLLRECVTVVKPGEHLILRVPWGTTPTQVRELQADLVKLTIWMDVPFKVLVLPGDELGVAVPGGVPGAA